MNEPLRQILKRLKFMTPGPAFLGVTDEINSWLSDERAQDGLLTILIQHTSASLTIQENADPDVQADLIDILNDLAPATRQWRHDAEGPDDMPAHVKSMLSGVSVSVPVVRGRMDLGTWQGVYLIEHRERGQKRTLSLCYQGT